MNLHSIEAFLAIAESASFTGAARRLGKTQSAVSQSIRHLEEELGVILVDRASRQIALTSAGDLLRSRATQLVADVKTLTSMLREHGQNKISQLRIGMVDSFSTVLGPTLIRGMLSEAQNLSMWSELTPLLGEALLENHVDIIVANEAFDAEPLLTRHELLREPFVLLLPSEAPWAQGDLDLAAMSRIYPMIRYRGASLAGSQIEAQCHRLGIMPLRRVSVDCTDKLVASVAAGIGWSIGTPMWLMRTPEFERQIRVLPIPGEVCYRHLFMVSRRGELDELALRLARLSTGVLRDLVDGDLHRRLPGLHGLITLPMQDSGAGTDADDVAKVKPDPHQLA